MKKKVLLLVSFCVIAFCSMEVQAINPSTTPIYYYNGDVNMPNEFEKIDLLGDLMLNHGPNAIVAGASENAIYIGFNQDFSNVNISIYNGMGGLVYSTVVNTAVQSVVIIPFSSVNGSYTVELSNAEGYAEGDFERN